MFAFRGPSVFSLFCSIVPPHLLASIRKLHIEVMYQESFPRMAHLGTSQPDFENETEWTEFWESVGQFKGLTTLEVYVTDGPAFWYHARTRHNVRLGLTADTSATLTEDFGLLEPLRTMRHLARFEVTLSQWCQVRPREDDPFQLKIREGMP